MAPPVSRRPLVPEDTLYAHPDVKLMAHKVHAGEPGGGTEFVLSDATPDRMGDVIEPAGWELRNFLRNPIALFNHRADFPLGTWKNLRVENGALRGHLQLAPAGTSERHDEIRRLVQADILRAVSVGFRVIASEPLTKDGRGVRFIKQELVETSLVSVPANPNALAVAKSLGISADTRKLVFAERSTNARTALVRQPSPAEIRVSKLEKQREQLLRRLLLNVDLITGARRKAAMLVGGRNLHSLNRALREIRVGETTVEAISNLMGGVEDQLRDAEREVTRLKRVRK